MIIIENKYGFSTLLEEMQSAKVRNLVFSSSCTVYGEPEKVPISEDFNFGPVQVLWSDKIH